MGPDLALAQASTLRLWSEMWEREAVAEPTIHAGYGEVAFLMRKAADRIVSVAAPEMKRHMVAPSAPEVFADHGIPPTAPTEGVRPDEDEG